MLREDKQARHRCETTSKSAGRGTYEMPCAVRTYRGLKLLTTDDIPVICDLRFSGRQLQALASHTLDDICGFG